MGDANDSSLQRKSSQILERAPLARPMSPNGSFRARPSEALVPKPETSTDAEDQPQSPLARKPSLILEKAPLARPMSPNGSFRNVRQGSSPAASLNHSERENPESQVLDQAPMARPMSPTGSFRGMRPLQQSSSSAEGETIVSLEPSPSGRQRRLSKAGHPIPETHPARVSEPGPPPTHRPATSKDEANEEQSEEAPMQRKPSVVIEKAPFARPMSPSGSFRMMGSSFSRPHNSSVSSEILTQSFGTWVTEERTHESVPKGATAEVKERTSHSTGMERSRDAPRSQTHVAQAETRETQPKRSTSPNRRTPKRIEAVSVTRQINGTSHGTPQRRPQASPTPKSMSIAVRHESPQQRSVRSSSPSAGFMAFTESASQHRQDAYKVVDRDAFTPRKGKELLREERSLQRGESKGPLFSPHRPTTPRRSSSDQPRGITTEESIPLEAFSTFKTSNPGPSSWTRNSGHKVDFPNAEDSKIVVVAHRPKGEAARRSQEASCARLSTPKRNASTPVRTEW